MVPFSDSVDEASGVGEGHGVSGWKLDAEDDGELWLVMGGWIRTRVGWNTQSGRWT